MTNHAETLTGPIEVSIILPCLNEAETLGACIDEAWAALAEAGVAGEVVVADNGSVDGSREIAQACGARLVQVEARGYGAALCGGIAASRGRWFLFADSDGSYNFHALSLFLDRLHHGAEFVIGCRFPRGGGRIEPGAMPWLHRWIGTPFLTFVGATFFRVPLNDFNSGMRAMDRNAFDRLNLRCMGMEFATEMIIKASFNDLAIAEVPITLRQDRRITGRPHLRSFRDGWRLLRLMLLLSPRWLFLLPAALCAAVGLTGGIPLLFGPVTVGGITFDTNTLLICATLVVLAHQLLAFGVVAELFASVQSLLSPDRRAKPMGASLSLEPILLGGFVAILLGFLLIVHLARVWKAVDFGPMSYSVSMRMVIPATTLVVLGLQTMFFGFLISLIQMRHLGGWLPPSSS